MYKGEKDREPIRERVISKNDSKCKSKRDKMKE